MCFSAGASFGASVILGTIGIVTLKKAKTKNEIPFASIPLLFAAQQAAEGVLWIGLSSGNNESWKHFPVYIFLIFAQLVWPVWIPFSILQLEKDGTRRPIIKGILGVGSCISLYLTYCILVYGVNAEIHSGHISYTLSFPTAFAWIKNVLYFVPTVVPLFISSIKRIQLLGLAVLVSFVFSKVYFMEHLISVWCFFAAILSIVICWIVSKLKMAVTQPYRYAHTFSIKLKIVRLKDCKIDGPLIFQSSNLSITFTSAIYNCEKSKRSLIALSFQFLASISLNCKCSE